MPVSPRIQRQYYRNGPPHRSGADVSFADLVAIFGFNSIHIGRWVTAAEQQLAANLFFDAFCDLQQILQVPAEVISLKGSLALTFGIGGQPGVAAFYQPQGRILALAKNAGGGSLAHEWFHAFDHFVAAKSFSVAAPTGRFASRMWLDNLPLKVHPLTLLLEEAFQLLYLSQDKQNPSAFFQHCHQLDQARQRAYLALPEEMAARAFETVLQSQPLKNSFLVSGTQKSAAAKLGIYPDATLTVALSHYWLSYFKQLGASLMLASHA
ncbi:CLCA_X family protein [Alishewanella sp. HL-SH06]|uniref:CLCA_X family protein n=1 Tax=Alishewanella sp. HL-SH06 TaxID=3461144 RepID=UPI004042C62C